MCKYLKMEKDIIIGTLVVSNKANRDLFRVHLYNNGIRFDENFVAGFNKNKKILKKLIEISQEWSEKKVEHQKLLFEIINTLKEDEKQISKYYFVSDELDENGKYI